MAAELRELLAWTEPGGLRQQTCQSLTRRTDWFAVGRCASNCQTLYLAGDFLQHLADLGTVSRDVLGLRIGRLPEIDRYEFLTLEPIQPFGSTALAQQGPDACEGNPTARTGLRC